MIKELGILNMCGRFTLANVNSVKEKIGVNLKANFNITPSHPILILEPKPNFVNWGLSPTWAKKPMNLINARIETLREKPAFKNTLPCLVVADGWYEWKKSNTKEKIPFYFHNNGKLIYMAGIYNSKGCAILTKDACSKIENIHHRQPILLNKSGRRNWVKERKILPIDYLSEINFHRVDLFVNSPKLNDPVCIKPISESSV